MIHEGDCLKVMPTLPAESVDAIVCDPPYGLSFMGKEWDHGVPGVAFWVEVLRVAKPGAHLVAFGGTRTYHRLTCAIEDAGWEVRDCLSWLYGSGFPKSHNGPWGGTALKPAWEPIILARKPLVGTVAANVAAHGTGGLNIDRCRIEGAPDPASWTAHRTAVNDADGRLGQKAANIAAMNAGLIAPPTGRWPANVCLDEEAAKLLDAQSGVSTSSPSKRRNDGKKMGYRGAEVPFETSGHGDSGGASRFFYCAKASRSEREAGLEGAETRAPAAESAHSTICLKCNRQRVNVRGACECAEPEWGRATQKPTANHHPTVKPIALMRWLCRLVTPPYGLILDPFTGSGTTGCAAVLEGFRFVGIEQNPEYAAIAEKRIAHHTPEPTLSLES